MDLLAPNCPWSPLVKKVSFIPHKSKIHCCSVKVVLWTASAMASYLKGGSSRPIYHCGRWTDQLAGDSVYVVKG